MQLESHNWPMDNKLALFMAGKICASVAVGGKLGIGKFPLVSEVIMELSGSRTFGPLLLLILFKIKASLSRM